MSKQQSSSPLRLLNPVSTLQGAQDSLAAINTSKLPNNSLVMVANALYQFRRSSSSAESSPNIIAPDQGGPGRWFLMTGGAEAFTTLSVDYTTIPPQSSVEVTGITMPGFVTSNDVATFSMRSTDLPATMVVGLPRNTGTEAGAIPLYNIGAATLPPGTISLRMNVQQSP